MVSSKMDKVLALTRKEQGIISMNSEDSGGPVETTSSGVSILSNLSRCPHHIYQGPRFY